MIQVSKLEKHFGSFKALKGIDLRVEKNDIYGFLGHNGAGKSTTINILAGLSRIDGGQCVVNGTELNKTLKAGQLGIGYLPEEPMFYNWMNPKEYLSYLGSDWSGKVSSRVDEMLEWVGLQKAAKRRIGGFSRGMKQRLGMAVALFYDPDLLLLDEPSSALDPEGRSDVLDMITRLKNEGKTIFLSTHILDDVERVCNKVGILSAGEMVAEMELRKLLDQYVVPVYDITFAKTPTHEEVEQMRKPKWVQRIEVQDNKITLRMHDDDKEDHRVYALAGTLETPVSSVMLRQSSLEDVFLTMTRKRGN